MTEDATDPAALHIRVTGLERQFEGFRKEIGGQFDKVNDRLGEILSGVQTKFDALGQNREASLGKILGIAGLVGSIATFVIGTFIQLASTNLNTNITFTNEKIAIESRAADKAITATDILVDKLAVAVTGLADKTTARFDRLVDQTVPKEQLVAQFSAIDSRLTAKVDKLVLVEVERRYDSQFASVVSDLDRLKGDIVGRREHEQHWAEFGDRLNKLSDRLNEVAKASAGTPAIDTIRQLQDQVQALTNRFVAVPKFPVLPSASTP